MGRQHKKRVPESGMGTETAAELLEFSAPAANYIAESENVDEALVALDTQLKTTTDAGGGASVPTITFAATGGDGGSITVSGAGDGEVIAFVQLNALLSDPNAAGLFDIFTGTMKVGEPTDVPSHFSVAADASGDMLLSLTSYKEQLYTFMISGDGWATSMTSDGAL